MRVTNLDKMLFIAFVIMICDESRDAVILLDEVSGQSASPELIKEFTARYPDLCHPGRVGKRPAARVGSTITYL